MVQFCGFSCIRRVMQPSPQSREKKGKGGERRKRRARDLDGACSWSLSLEDFPLFPKVTELQLPGSQINSLTKQSKRGSKRKLFIRKTETHRVKKLSCTDQKCNHRRQALRVFQSLWGCINLKSCYIKEKNVWERPPPRVTLD